MSANPFKAGLTIDRLALNRLGLRVRNLERSVPRPSNWAYATPLAPAPDPSDESDTGDNQPFQNGWGNIALPDGSYSPLRWRISHAGRAEIVGAIDGGALGTVCVTLPSLYWPSEDTYAVVSSTDGTRALTVEISASTGEVTVVGVPAAAAAVGDGQVGTDQLADGSVTTAKIADGAVTPAKLEDTAVTPGTYGDGTHVGQFTVDDDGRLTAASNVAITGGGGSSPLTTKGDLWGFDTVDDRIPVGSDGDVLTADSGASLGVSWQTPGGGGGGDTLNTVASSGSSQTVDFGTADVWDITLTAACTLSLTGFTNGQPDFLTLILRQDGTGSRLVTWPTITWIGTGVAPTLQTAPSSVDSVVLFSFDGGTTVYGIAQTSASGLGSGTSFPGSPSDGDLFYRTDRRILYEYNSTVSHWLSLERKYWTFGAGRISGGGTSTGIYSLLPLFEDIYIETWQAVIHITTTNNGSNFWTVTLHGNTTAQVGTSIASFTTAADSTATNTLHSVSVASVLSASTYSQLSVDITKTGAPTLFDLTSVLVCRSIG